MLPLLDTEQIKELQIRVRHQIMQADDKELIPMYMRQLESLSLLGTKPAKLGDAARAPVYTASPIKFPSLTNKISVLQKLETIRKSLQLIACEMFANFANKSQI